MQITERDRGVIVARAVVIVVCAAVLVFLVLSVVALSRFGSELSLGSFLLTDAVIGACLAACGAIVAFVRPGNAVGWLFLAAGLGYAATAGLVSAIAIGLVPDPFAQRVVLTVALAAWPPAISGLLAIAVMLFPTGRPISRLWWVFIGLAAVWAVLFTIAMLVMDDDLPLLPGVRTFAPVTDPAVLEPMGAVIAVLAIVSEGAAIVALAWRLIRGNDTVRRQLLWVLLAVLVVFVTLALPFTEISILFAVVLIPLAIVIAIVRHQLFDIRFVFSRALLYTVMASLAVGVYLALVVAINWLLQTEAGLGGSLVATVAVAIAFNPVRVRLQSAVDRLFYGSRRNPERALRDFARELDAGADGIEQSLGVLCTSLKLPSARLTEGGALIAEWGSSDDRRESVALTNSMALEVALRRGEFELSRPDRRALELIAVPLATAVRASRLADEVERSRQSELTARDEERARLRRELHDGLGPTLASIVFTSEAARRVAPNDAAQAQELMERVRVEAGGLSAEVRRLIDALRPAALDEVGLVDAIAREGHRLLPLEVRVESSGAVSHLSPDIEAAVYRIATEALTNAARHSEATTASVRIGLTDTALELEIADDGGEANRPWVAGIGLGSMRRRAQDLGATLTAGPGPHGGVVRLVLPLETVTP